MRKTQSIKQTDLIKTKLKAIYNFTENNIKYSNTSTIDMFLNSNVSDTNSVFISYEGISNLEHCEDGSMNFYNDIYTLYIKLKNIDSEVLNSIIIDFNNIDIGNFVLPIFSMSIENGIIIIGTML